MKNPASTASAITDEQIDIAYRRIKGVEDSPASLPYRQLARWAFEQGALCAPTAQPTGQAEGETPFAYYVHFPDADRGELVHDLDELTEDLTNERHEITPLYTRPVAAVEPSQPAENARLRQIISECAAALGNGSGISPECSVEFMGHLPEEIRAVIASTSPAPAAPSPDAQDAARYRYLRDGPEEWGMFEDRWLVATDIYGQGPLDMDTAIDAALAASTKGETL